MNVDKAKQDACGWIEKFTADHMLKPGRGALSYREKDIMIITKEGCNFENASAGDWVEISLNGLSFADKDDFPEGQHRLHAAVYQKKKNYNALAHVHSPYVTTAAKAGRTILPMLEDLAQLIGPSVNVAPYQTPINDDICAGLVKKLFWRSAALFFGNGAICCGASFDDAHAVAQVLEKGCKTTIETAFLGGGKAVSPLETYAMHLIYKVKYSKAAKKNK